MKLYIILISIANLLIILTNSFFKGEVLKLVFKSVFATVFVIALDGIGAYLVRRLPEEICSPEKDRFPVTKREREFYKKIGIKSWKTKVPELGGFTNFHKDKIESKTDKKYLFRFLLEINYGGVIHLQNAIFGFLTMLLPFPIFVTLPVAIVNFILSLMPMAVLRYNQPVLKALYIKAK